MSVGEATGREHAKHAGVNWMADDSVRSALYQLVMFEDTRLQTPLFAESAHGGGDENQGCEHEEDDQRRDDVLRAPIDRQKRSERFARDHPGNGERKCLNEDRDHGAAISFSRFAAGSVAHKQEDRAENNVADLNKMERPEVKPARHHRQIETLSEPRSRTISSFPSFPHGRDERDGFGETPESRSQFHCRNTDPIHPADDRW